jgi:hypothetical protein
MKKLSKFSFICLILSSFQANAATYTLLESPLLVGQMNGPDLLWNTGDDFSSIATGSGIYGGFNPNGAATQFLFDGVPLFGSLSGQFETSSGPGVGTSTITNYTTDFFLNDFTIDPPAIGLPREENLNTANPASFTINANNTASSSLFVDVSFPSAAPFDTFELTGSYNYLLAGQDPNVVFAGQTAVIDQFNYLLSSLPIGWTAFFIGQETFSFLSGPTGQQSGIFYTTSAVPLPAAFWLFCSALIGLITVSKRKTV